MKKHALVCILLLLFMVLIPQMGSSQSISLKMMSFNIQQPYGTNWDARKDSAVAIINIENPDIIGTQEAVNYQRDYLLANTKGYSWFGEGRDGGDNGEGSWIFYKSEKFKIDSLKSGSFWLSETPSQVSRLGGSYNRICTYALFTDKTSDKSFYVFNIHNYMPEENSLRLAAAKILVSKLTSIVKTEPFILTGDFNSPEEDDVTLWLKSGSDNPFPLIDSYRVVHPTGFATTGFGTKYDYIYYRQQPIYGTLDTKIITIPSNASDHLPITATISINY